VDEQALRSFFNEHGPRWILEQEAMLRKIGHPLPDDLQIQLTPFFGPALSAGLAYSVPITNPPWYGKLLAQGADKDDLLDFTAIRGGITFNTAINICAGVPWTPNLLFHEMVHVIQYRVLGIDEFARRYVDRWFAARVLLKNPRLRYCYIPLERQAYDLQYRYTAAPTSPFSVEGAVRGAESNGSQSVSGGLVEP
jgi:hypothetical protein